MRYSFLSHRTVFHINGVDSISFLQGLVTNDMGRLERDPALYTALLTPQGKYQHAFFLYRTDDGVLLDCDDSHAGPLQKRLMMYRLRAKVAIEPNELVVTAIWDAANDELDVWRKNSVLCVPDPRLAELGYRALLTPEEMAVRKPGAEPREAYEQWRLSHAVPDEAHDLIAEKSFPLQFGFEALRAVDFNKGCYVGQEVTARTKHRGTLRKIVCGLDSGKDHLPAHGAPLYAQGKLVGEMLSSQHTRGLALLQAECVLVDAPPLLSDASDTDGYLKPFVPSWFSRLLAS